MLPGYESSHHLHLPVASHSLITIGRTDCILLPSVPTYGGDLLHDGYRRQERSSFCLRPEERRLFAVLLLRCDVASVGQLHLPRHSGGQAFRSRTTFLETCTYALQ